MFYSNLYLILVVVTIIFRLCFLCFVPLSNIHVSCVCININSTLQIRSYWEQLSTWQMLHQYIMRKGITIMFFIFVMLPVTFLCSCDKCRNTNLDCIWLLSPHALNLQPDKILSYNKAYIDEEDEEEWSSQSDEEKGQKELQKTINYSNDIVTKKRKRKSSHVDKISYSD